MKLKFALAAASLGLLSQSALADCQLDAKAVVSGMVKLPPFHLTIKTTSKNIESKMTGDVVMPDSFKLVFGNSATIVTPRGAWASVNGKWQAQSADAAANMRHVLLSGIADDLATMRNVKCNAKAKVQGKTYKSIEYDVFKNRNDKTPLAHKKVLLGKDSRPLWIITQGFSQSGNSAIVQKFDYDPTIRITDPM